MASHGSVPTIGVHVTEDHNEVLEHIYRAIGSKVLPFSGNTLLHFDSHPDLLIPINTPADDVYDKGKLFSSISIENWIMPALYAGHISTVIWIKKDWATQIADGSYRFAVGKDKVTDAIRCSCSEPYFVSELLYSPPEQLVNRKDITVIVQTCSTTEQMDTIAAHVRNVVAEGSEIILDIDLDYFSTTNPFVDLYSSEQLNILASLYHFKVEATIEQSVEKRSQQLKFLHDTMANIANRSLKISDTLECEDDRITMIGRLIDEEVKAKGSVDVDLLHEHGCTFDTSGLPHHISTPSEIDIYITDFTQLLTRLKITPRIITVARSSVDDYCPETQVDLIQDKTTSSLKSIYSNLSIKKHYL